MADDFRLYDSGFGWKRFNRIIKLIRKYRVNPSRPGWNQTEDGVDPPPILDGGKTSARPFTIAKIDDTTVQVRDGYCFHAGSWKLPTWEGGDDFDTDKTISASAVLFLRHDIIVDGNDVSADAIKIGWDLAVGTGLPTVEYDVDFTGETITETTNDGEVLIEIGAVTFTGGAITSISQKLDYNPILPYHGDVLTTVTSGGTT